MTMLPSRAPLLIVPIRDRRQSRRILTIKNCAITMLSVAVVFAFNFDLQRSAARKSRRVWPPFRIAGAYGKRNRDAKGMT